MKLCHVCKRELDPEYPKSRRHCEKRHRRDESPTKTSTWIDQWGRSFGGETYINDRERDTSFTRW
jgi:hypothetical protein